jgi:2-polyprenyl-3-methyl-5-hydroxy-6-metoxy-1,4-benzoquinol methylase/Tfp pilus assembly protein PilF
MTGLRVLTFNFHEPYICLMAQTGLPITVGLYEAGELRRDWQQGFRPIPRNVRLAPEAEWRRELKAGGFDVLVAHNEANAASVFKSTIPALLVCHNRRSMIEANFVPGDPQGSEAYGRLLDLLQERFGFIFISESKRDDYGIPGRVILPGIDVAAYGGYEGDCPEVLRVGNAMRERTRMFDVDFQEAVVAGISNRVLGDNRSIPHSRPTESYEELLWHYRHLRCLLHVAREDWEDGYNLSMLEAMACGMPVVALANPTSPITDGVDGFAAYDAAVLRERIQLLLQDAAAAREVGARGRDTVARAFPMERFVEEWRRVLEETAAGGRARLPGVHPRSRPRRYVLLEYRSGPASVGRYAEWALRRHHEVVTLGERLEVKHGARPSPTPRYPVQQLDPACAGFRKKVWELAASDTAPEVYLLVQETVDERAHAPLDLLSVRRVLWCPADAPNLEVASQFELVYLGQNRAVEPMRAAGFAQAQWLPPACAPELFDFAAPDTQYDVLIAGTLDAFTVERFGELRTHVLDRAWPHAAARAMAGASIVVHVPRGEALEFELLQALCSGALVLTRPAPGLEALFADGVHLVVWREPEDLAAKVQHYLADADSRIRIAEAGRAHVLAHHSFEHRMEQIMSAIREMPAPSRAADALFDVGGYYGSPRPELAEHVPAGARRVLDVGCGAGEFGRALKASRGVREVVGIEIVEPAWHLARGALDDAILGNIETLELPFADGHFDCITCGDVLEHLVDPEETLKKLRRVLAPEGVVVASIPNARFYQVVEMLANGRWMYQDAGILDRTHLRFFTAVEMIALFRRAGLDVRTIAPLSMMPREALPIDEEGYVHLQKLRIGPLSPDHYQDFLVYQYLVIGEKAAGNLLQRAQDYLETKANDAALDAALRAREQGEDALGCLRVMAKAAARLGRLDDSDGWYREALALDGTDAELLGEYGLVLIGRGRVLDARRLLELSQRIAPTNGRVLSGLGLCALAAGELERAYEHFERSLEQEFDNRAALDHLVQAAAALGRLAEAEPHVKRYVEFYPGNLEVALVHASLLADLRRDDEARERIASMLLLDPQHAGARALLEQIAARG